MTIAQDKFQRLLRELFQFDCSDLDFGIYRIMNYKRDVIEKFISTDLPMAIADELDRGALADQSHAAAELTETANQIAKTLGKDALDADGNLSEAYHGTPLGKKYLALQGKAVGGRGREALEATIFNHLYTFFSRYYQDGDFISKRRYSKRQKYAIPYNGEEVYLHWANHDQYYVKTAEHFHDYTFTSRGVTVHFKLTAANVEQNNVKGDKRFFLPRVKEIDWNKKAGELIIPFEFRPITDQEKVAYGKKNQQDKIIAESVEAIPKRLNKADKPLVAITAERRKNSDGETVSFLEHHLRQYTRANTSDFFIHKDLKGFLSRELDFYLKNEVLNLDEMEAAGEDRTEGWFQVLRAIRAVGSRIIDFLDQIESLQKMLWEKRKFITDTQYCITVGTINESFYPDIVACDAQWAEWKELFHIDEEESDLFSNGKSTIDRRIEFLKTHPALVLDTVHLAEGLADRLLAHYSDLDGTTDLLLIHGENWQALRLLADRYQNQIQCLYADPPYNAKNTDFLYKNDFKHSSWMSMMADRLVAAMDLRSHDGALITAIDDNESANLAQLLRAVRPSWQHDCISVVHNPAGVQGDNFSYSHEYAMFSYEWQKNLIGKTARAEESEESFRDWGGTSARSLAKNCFYPIIVEDGEIVDFGDVCDDDFHPESSNVKVGTSIYLYPMAEDGEERKWVFARNSVEAIWHELSVREKDGVLSIARTKTTTRYKTVWADKTYYANIYGSKLLNNILGEKRFDFPKSLHTVQDSLFAVDAFRRDGAICLDYFAGSGTTGHASINLCREDGVRRKAILIEMGKHFDTAVIPRIKRVAFTPEWSGGRPVRKATPVEVDRGPRLIKYCRLESFEDTLNNLIFDEGSGQSALQFDDFLIHYMLKWETRKSETLLNVEQLAKPFSYKLTVAKGDDTIEKVVDLPETFNYLLGLHVSTRKVYDDDGRRYLVYHGRIDHRRIAVIWRETEGWQKKDLERDKKFVAEQKLAAGADEVFVNGDSFIPNAKALEPVFKARMFSSVEA